MAHLPLPPPAPPVQELLFTMYLPGDEEGLQPAGTVAAVEAERRRAERQGLLAADGVGSGAGAGAGDGFDVQVSHAR